MNWKNKLECLYRNTFSRLIIIPVSKWGEQCIQRENPKVFWVEFSTLSQAVFARNCIQAQVIPTVSSRVENSTQVSSCRI